MRLLNTYSLQLEFFAGDIVPPYAILSHTWEKDEVTYEQLQNGSYAASSQGWIKIQQSARIAAQQQFDYIWIDTCCIDKSSSAELSEAINSMFRWYEQSSICYAYLSDYVSRHNHKGFVSTNGKDGSRWFTRGWTLQELIAPRNVDFYDRDWTLMGTRSSLSAPLHKATGIPLEMLSFKPTDRVPTITRMLELTSVAERMGWAAKRKTTRGEDTAYSLLGLFDINMPLLYGEGRKKAFRRLQEEIIRSTDDESIFVWRLEDEPPSTSPFCGLLADGPECFGRFVDLIPRRLKYLPVQVKRGLSTVSSRGVQVDLSITPHPKDQSGTIFLALLACYMEIKGSQTTLTPSILLQRMSHEDEAKFVRVRADLVLLCMMNLTISTALQGSFTNPPQRPRHKREGSDIAFSLTTAQPKSIFVPNTIMPPLTPNGILFVPAIKPPNAVPLSLAVASRSPTWDIIFMEAAPSGMVEGYQVNFNLNPVPAVEDMTEPVMCGVMELLVSYPSLGGLISGQRRICLVVGVEQLPPNVFGTPGLYAVPWFAFEELDKVRAGDFADVKDRERRRIATVLTGDVCLTADIGLEVRHSALFYKVTLK